MRDTAIGRFIEELTIKNINIIIHYNNSDIISYFISNKSQLKLIIEKISSEDVETKHDGILFLLELIQCSKELLHNRLFFFESLCESGIFEALEKSLVDVTHYSSYNKYLDSLKDNIMLKEDSNVDTSEKKERIKVNAIEILINILTAVPSNIISIFFRYFKIIYHE